MYGMLQATIRRITEKASIRQITSARCESRSSTWGSWRLTAQVKAMTNQRLSPKSSGDEQGGKDPSHACFDSRSTAFARPHARALKLRQVATASEPAMHGQRLRSGGLLPARLHFDAAQKAIFWSQAKADFHGNSLKDHSPHQG